MLADFFFAWVLLRFDSLTEVLLAGVRELVKLSEGIQCGSRRVAEDFDVCRKESVDGHFSKVFFWVSRFIDTFLRSFLLVFRLFVWYFSRVGCFVIWEMFWPFYGTFLRIFYGVLGFSMFLRCFANF